MGKRYKSVSSAIKDLGVDKEFSSDLDREIADRSIARTLFSMRCAEGLNQEKMAKRIGCSQSRISKIETSSNKNIKAIDLIEYAKALNLELSISFHKHRTAVQWIKYHAFEIKSHLDRLAKLAHKDESIDESVTHFFGETLFSLIRLIQKSATSLPDKKRKLITVISPLTEDEPEGLFAESSA